MTRQQGLIAALVFSTTLNLLVGGVLVGRLLDDSRRPGPPPMAWAARELPAELRGEVRAHMRERMSSARPLRGELREAARELRLQAQAEPVDREALGAALRRMREARGAYEAFMHESLLDVLEKLPPEQRLALLREVLHRRGHRGGPPPSPQQDTQ